jgi:DNA-binding protein HU-beta
MKFTMSAIQEILRGFGLDSVKAREAIEKVFNAMSESLAAGEALECRGFGSLEVKERKAAARRNPRTGEAVFVSPSRCVVFHPGRELKAALRGATRSRNDA